MINRKSMLEIIHDANGTMTSYKNEAADFARDSFTIALDKDNDYLYIGFNKPFYNLYVELETANTNANSFTAEYYDDEGSWSSLTLLDETKGFTRSGFIQWRKNLGLKYEDSSNNIEEWDETTVNGVEAYYIRLRPSATHSSTAVRGIGLVFSDDQDLAAEFYGISDYLSSRDSFILVHASARDKLIQDLTDKGAFNTGYDGQELLTPFDIFRIEELRLASTYLALSLIFENASDDPDGNLANKAITYRERYQRIISKAQVTHDIDDDGIMEDGEKTSKLQTRIMTR